MTSIPPKAVARQPSTESGIKLKAWLVLKSGSQAGTRYLLRGSATRVGRDPSNHLVIQGEDAAGVSAHHLEIRREGDRFDLYDLSSTNGTYLNGERVTEASLVPDAVITLGSGGPELAFHLEQIASSDVDKTVLLPAEAPLSGAAEKAARRQPSGSMDRHHEELLSDAVRRARVARQSGEGEQTHILMREVMHKVLHRSRRKSRIVILLLVVLVLGVSGYASWAIQEIRREKDDIDGEIRGIEARLQAGTPDGVELEQLIEKLSRYQDQAHDLQKNLLYRLGVRNLEQDFVETEIKTLMAEFGAEAYSVPPEFVEQVHRFIRQYQGRDRGNIERVLGRSRNDFEIVREVLRKNNLPPDLAYMVLVESAFISESESEAGAVGLWQFTAATAEAYGMVVDEQLDERLDIRKSSEGASRYIRDLILDFGAGSSVMLALAAYNVGPGKVRRAVRKVDDPIKQRNFWYLYRSRTLPPETREYVPKIMAAIIIGRNPERFGFGL